MKIYHSRLDRDRFRGVLHVPDRNRFPGKAILVLGGGDGQFTLTRYIASVFADHGMTAMAVQYWNGPGLPDTFTNIPLETVQRAGEFLKARGIKKVGLWGISAGAEYALVCGSYYPALFSAIVAVSPSAAVIQGFQMLNAYHLVPRPCQASPFTYGGKPLPYVPTDDITGECFRQSVEQKTVSFAAGYAHNFERTTEDTAIHAENCGGPILLLAADEDDMWDSRRACEELCKRLEEKQFLHNVEFYHYAYGSHILFPHPGFLQGMYAMERRHPERYRESCEDSFRKTLEFFRKW